MTLAIFGKSDLNRALPLYFGKGSRSWPERDFNRVVEEIGARRAAAIEAELHAVVAELYAVGPDWTLHSDLEAATFAVDRVRARFPALDDAACESLFWEYTWNFR